MTIFGGNNCFSTRFNDVWVLSNANGLGGTPVWTQLAPSGTPPPATNFQSAVYDQGSNRMILYGINPTNGTQDTPTNQVWVLTSANGLGGTPTWIQLSPPSPGPVKTDQATVYDPSSNTMIVFGGFTPGASSGTYVFTNDTWVLANANGLGGTPTWTQLNPSGGPPAIRASMGTVYDPATKRMIIFGGGNSTSSFNDVWTLTVVATGDNVPPVTLASLSPQPNGASWNNSNVMVALNSTDNESNGTGVKQITHSATGAQPIASTTVPAATASFIVSNEGITTISFFATDNAANVETAKSITVQLDKTPPSVNCSSPDGLWHAADVSISCTASDALSGLANPPDASFSLSTSVPAGTETSNAATGTRSVCDVAGNCATAGPVAGNMVDKKPPTINVSSPTAGGSYLLNQAVNANYACTDGGSGVATCTGTVASGSPINTASVGSKSFTVNATDNVGNVAPTQTVSYSVAYGVCVLYDPTRAVQSGSTIPLKIQLCDANNADSSSSAVVVHGVSLVQTSTNASELLQASGNANPDNDFRFDSTLGPTGGYIFNLSTKGLTTGTYQLTFTAGADLLPHTLSFQVR